MHVPIYNEHVGVLGWGGGEVLNISFLTFKHVILYISLYIYNDDYIKNAR